MKKRLCLLLLLLPLISALIEETPFRALLSQTYSDTLAVPKIVRSLFHALEATPSRRADIRPEFAEVRIQNTPLSDFYLTLKETGGLPLVRFRYPSSLEPCSRLSLKACPRQRGFALIFTVIQLPA